MTFYGLVFKFDIHVNLTFLKKQVFVKISFSMNSSRLIFLFNLQILIEFHRELYNIFILF